MRDIETIDAGLRPTFASTAWPAVDLLSTSLARRSPSNGTESRGLLWLNPRIRVLDYRRNLIVRKVRLLLGKTTLYRINLLPLF